MEVKFNFNIKRKYMVNGKEYNSLEEMPAAIREAYEKAVSKGGGINFEKISSRKIVFNGQEYAGVDSMPTDKRQIYETIMNEVKSEEGVPMETSDFQIGAGGTGLKDKGMVTSGDVSRPITPQLFSSRALLIVGAIIVVLVAIYIVLGIGSH